MSVSSVSAGFYSGYMNPRKKYGGKPENVDIQGFRSLWKEPWFCIFGGVCPVLRGWFA
jgi:hypothetical protein